MGLRSGPAEFFDIAEDWLDDAVALLARWPYGPLLGDDLEAAKWWRPSIQAAHQETAEWAAEESMEGDTHAFWGAVLKALHGRGQMVARYERAPLRDVPGHRRNAAEVAEWLDAYVNLLTYTNLYDEAEALVWLGPSLQAAHAKRRSTINPKWLQRFWEDVGALSERRYMKLTGRG
jgi:hypothetical protein